MSQQEKRPDTPGHQHEGDGREIQDPGQEPGLLPDVNEDAPDDNDADNDGGGALA